MLDITFIRENPDLVKIAMQNKHCDVDLDLLLRLADDRKKLAGEVAEVNRKRNLAADARDAETGKRLKDESKEVEERYAALEKELVTLLVRVPNIPSVDTPVGNDESGNLVVRSWGEKPNFSFTPKAHWDLGKELGVVDSEKAAEVSGARFTYLKGDLVLLQYALQHFVAATLTSEETIKIIVEHASLNVSTKPFVPVLPPLIVRKSVQVRMARYITDQDHYLFPEDETMLIGSSEHTLGPIHMDETISESRLPLRYFACTPAFRREAGAAGKDTRGFLRQHQFDKSEMESFTLPEDGRAEQDFLVAIQEYLMQKLKLPYQVVSVCTGDMGFPDQRQIDIETWMAGQNAYRETHSADYIGGFQARRLNTKVRRADGTTEPIHMNDATALSQRPLIALMEHYQNEDSTITVPEVLRPFMMGKEKIEKTAG